MYDSPLTLFDILLMTFYLLLIKFWIGVMSDNNDLIIYYDLVVTFGIGM